MAAEQWAGVLVGEADAAAAVAAAVVVVAVVVVGGVDGASPYVVGVACGAGAAVMAARPAAPPTPRTWPASSGGPSLRDLASWC